MFNIYAANFWPLLTMAVISFVLAIVVVKIRVKMLRRKTDYPIIILFALSAALAVYSVGWAFSLTGLVGQFMADIFFIAFFSLAIRDIEDYWRIKENERELERIKEETKGIETHGAMYVYIAREFSLANKELEDHIARKVMDTLRMSEEWDYADVMKFDPWGTRDWIIKNIAYFHKNNSIGDF